jgi:hypothetical protein
VTRAEELIAQGGQKRATCDAPRLSEMAGMYREIDLSVHLEPFHLEAEKGCSGCLAAYPDLHKTAYTRKREGSS